MQIKIFGPGCPRCKKTEQNAVEALRELNLEANVVEVGDLKEIMSHGIMMTPGLAIDEKVVSTGKIPSVEEIKKWLEEETDDEGSGMMCKGSTQYVERNAK